jgi:hypothetical protein
VRAGLAALTAATFLVVSPAHACHRFSVWKYPFPQRCAVARVQAVQEDRSWFVEIGAEAYPTPDERTPEQIADQRDHDEALTAHKDEINDLMKVLKLNERIAGFQGVDDK